MPQNSIDEKFWFRLWLGVIRKQAITWANVGLDYATIWCCKATVSKSLHTHCLGQQFVDYILLYDVMADAEYFALYAL